MTDPLEERLGEEGPTDEAPTGEAPPGTILAPSPLLTLGAFLVGLSVEWIWPVGLLPWAWNLGIGTVLLAGGALLFGGALRTMRSRGKHPSHADEPPELITAGPFWWSRNPIYTGHSLIHLGASFVADSFWPILTLVPILLYLQRVIGREETRLESLFGTRYERYCQEVRRWL
ncbi:methyltransferase family protein [Salinibacter altiplanensis]|uniref:methyltransferase family protein n=1 Tax=Salinibacter altiplanensis TaxID=1803181 RepID=UPI00131A4B3A|nr:isoprenylcysteine carboxylmethyltransferase family protein [Salinibacter altiplanensis]